MKEETKNYETKAEAEKVALAFLEEKYDQKFTLVGEGTLEKEKNTNYFKTKFKDKAGLEAEIQLPQEKKSSVSDVLGSGIAGTNETYSQVFYTKKTREAIEPLFKDEPFEKYFISISGHGINNTDLSLSVNEYFKETGDEYDLNVILPNNQNAEYYAKIIYPFYQKLISKQSNTFGVSIFANNLEIFTKGFVKSKQFNPELSYEEVLENVQDGLNGSQPQPDEKWLRSKYYNGENG